jgi:hypothetical protein
MVESLGIVRQNLVYVLERQYSTACKKLNKQFLRQKEIENLAPFNDNHCHKFLVILTLILKDSEESEYANILH